MLRECELNLKKYLYNYVHLLGVHSPDHIFKSFANSLSNYSVEDFSTEELKTIGGLIKKGLESNLGNATREWLETRYENSKVFEELIHIAHTGDYEYADNFRISDGSTFEDALYQVSKHHGCCGFYDSTMVADGKTYKVGFNYGH